MVADLVCIPPLQFTCLLAASAILMFGFAGFGYLTNDWADMHKDALANKPNALEATSVRQRVGLLALFLLMIAIPWLVLPFTVTSALFVLIELFLFVSYAFPPLRLKEKGWIGLVADAGYAHVVPVLFAGYTFGAVMPSYNIPVKCLMLTLGIWQAVVGIRNILLHQIQDAEYDRQSGTRTFLFNADRIRSVESFLQSYLIPAEAIALAILFAFTLYHQQPLVVLLFLAFIVWQWFYKKLRVQTINYRKFLYTYADPYYGVWLPVSLLFTYLLHAAGVYFFIH